jgi:hypothetical protein
VVWFGAFVLLQQLVCGMLIAWLRFHETAQLVIHQSRPSSSVVRRSSSLMSVLPICVVLSDCYIGDLFGIYSITYLY